MLDWPIKLAQAFQGLITKENMTDPSIIINQFRIKVYIVLVQRVYFDSDYLFLFQK